MHPKFQGSTEKEGGRHQTFTVENADLVRAEVINELKVK